MVTRSQQPRVLAHRGSSESAPEHTLASYRAALAAGADGLECDVRLTRDAVPVCLHDRRVDRTSDGAGVLSTLELADLAGLDFAAGAA
jgi:glycerophosphoryl diester phosphodiesterase